MNFTKPLPNTFTLYCKSGCINCTKAKDVLSQCNYKFQIIDCDAYLTDDVVKAAFLQFIKNLASKEHKTFPIIFHDGEFVGGYTDLHQYLDRLLDFSESF